MNQDQTQVDQYDVANYNRPTYVTHEVVDEEGDKCVIIAPGGIHTGKNKDGEDYTKAFFIVQFPSGRKYDFRFGVSTSRGFTEKFGSSDMRKWCGAKLILTKKENGGFKFVEAVVSETPAEQNAKSSAHKTSKNG